MPRAVPVYGCRCLSGSHHQRLSRYQATVASSASPKSRSGAQPSASHLRGVDRVAAVVAEPVLDVVDHRLVVAEELEDRVGELAVGDLVAGADVVDLADRALAQHEVDAGAVVLDEAPVADVQPVAVERHLLPVEQVRDEERDDLLGELVRPEVVRRPGDDDRQPVGLVVRERDQVGAGLRRGVRRAGLERVGLGERALLDRAVHLVGRDVQEPLDADAAGDVAHHVGAVAVGADELVGVDDRAVDVALGREVHDRVVAVHRARAPRRGRRCRPSRTRTGGRRRGRAGCRGCRRR